MSRTVAAFDFDGTLTRRDTLLPFLTRVAGPTRVALAVAAAAPWYPVRGRDAAKARLLGQLLDGRSRDELTAVGDEYGAHLARTAITPAMRDRLTWHRDEGHEIVIVSATLDVYLNAAARDLEIEHVICTSLESANCRGAEKARRLRAHLRDDNAIVWAYGNSAGDREMLALAQHPIRVRRGQPLT